MIDYLLGQGICEESYKTCANLHYMSINSVKNIWKDYSESNIIAPNNKRTRKLLHGSLDPEDHQFAIDLMDRNPELFYREIAELIFRKSGNYYSTNQIDYIFRTEGYTYKVLHCYII